MKPLCSVEGCGREAHYVGKELCQKHYFRQWRYGTTDLSKRRSGRYENPAGYQLVHSPGHPLAVANGYVFEHRKVLFEAIGPGDMDCELCGVRMTWKTCRVDHIDNNPRNNERSNLRPTCNSCNSHRGIRPPIEWGWVKSLTYQGETKTARDWAKDPRVQVPYSCIAQRMRRGMSDEDALFAPKKTHNGNGRKRIRASRVRTRPQSGQETN